MMDRVYNMMVLKRAAVYFVIVVVATLLIGQAQGYITEKWEVSCTMPDGVEREEASTFFYSYGAAREWATNWLIIEPKLDCKIETVYR